MSADKPGLDAAEKMRDALLTQLEQQGGDAMEGIDLDSLKRAMHAPNALEVMGEIIAVGPGDATPGAKAPDFELPFLAGHGGGPGETQRLSAHAGKRPVALIFGSYT